MHIAVLAASGKTGQQLVLHALDRGHTVTAIARRPEALELPASDLLTRASGDVRDRGSIARAVEHADVVVSGLGAVRGDAPGVLLAGARALIGAGSPRILWLGAFGTGRSADIAGALTRGILTLALGSELPDKVAADGEILAAGGTVFHSGPLTNGRLATYHTVPLDAVRRRLIPSSFSRATVASAMLDEAEGPARGGQLLVPVLGPSPRAEAVTS
ncbi:NAD(P)-dependent oxidoreductase [uncultured Microbacterium sp.]|uniref:NAD(P)-dependent oxidoreductase n=1 Tax=uncultured Microbacterium sp. TaxID=191216 RepID=UPI0035CBBF4E